VGWRPNYPKPETQKQALREVLLQLRPDVLALQEMGPLEYLLELQADLKALGLDYPYTAWCEGQDVHRHLAVLSRIAFAVHPVCDISVNENPGTFIKRGFLYLKFESPHPWSLGVVHLKSSEFVRKPSGTDPGKAQREAEAASLMAWFDKNPHSMPDILLGDFNDGPRSGTLELFTSVQKSIHFDRLQPRDTQGFTWTFCQQKSGIHSTLDHVLVNTKTYSSGHSVAHEVYLYDAQACLKASDHRLLYCTFD
ncbi:MAG: hypothetical protein B7X06_01950, partial [Verrucomicrobia bacterium 21-51-4]